MVNLTSESRLSEKKFKELSSSDQRSYLGKYPKSKYHKLAKKEALTPKPSNKEKPEQKSEKKEKDVDFDQAKVEVNKSTAIDVRMEHAIDKKVPAFAASVHKGQEELAANSKAVAETVTNKISSSLKDSIGNIFEKMSAGFAASEADRKHVKKVAGPFIKYGLGAAAGILLGPALLPVLGIMAMQYASTFSFGEDMESKSYEGIQEDRLEFLAKDISRWMSKIDMEMLTKRLSELSALKDMDEDMNGESEEGEEDDDEMTSESKVSTRLTFKLLGSQKRLTPNLRTRWDINNGSDVVGQIQADPKIKGNGHEIRCWVVTLEDGFDESAYNSGFRTTEPFTTVNKGRLLLRNPQRLTMAEARLWAKHAINKSYLQG